MANLQKGKIFDHMTQHMAFCLSKCQLLYQILSNFTEIVSKLNNIFFQNQKRRAKSPPDLNNLLLENAYAASFISSFAGIGFGFIYLPAIVSVSMYFESKRAFATGIAVCGSGLGTFIMAPVTRW